MDENKSSMGPLVGAIIVVVILIAGGIYFFGKQQAPSTETPAVSQTENPGLPNDDLVSIENDLTAAGTVSTADVDAAIADINTAIDAK